MPLLERLLVVTHVPHYRHAGKLYAYSAYARELDIWAELFPQVLIAAPCADAAPPGDTEPFTQSNITLIPQRETGGNTLRAKLWQCALLPWLGWDLLRALRQADAIHVRCPGNLGLLGAALAPLCSRYRIAKYAGQWTGYPGEALTVKLQRALLRSRWWGAPVTVYGDWPGQAMHVIPFFTSLLTNAQMAQARAAAQRKLSPPPDAQPLRVLYVGRLTAAKNVAVLLTALASLKRQGIPFTCDIVGDGPERARLTQQAEQAGLNSQVNFAGGVDFVRVLAFYEHNDVLVLASETEGWPKAIAEAMAFGLVCIGSRRGLVPQMLAEGRGLVIEPRDENALTQALQKIAQSGSDFLPMRARAAEWAQQYSLEGLREALRALMMKHWRVEWPAPALEKPAG